MSDEDAARDNRLDSNDFKEGDYVLDSESSEDPDAANVDTISSVFGPHNSSDHSDMEMMQEIEKDPNIMYYEDPEDAVMFTNKVFNINRDYEAMHNENFDGGVENQEVRAKEYEEELVEAKKA